MNTRAVSILIRAIALLAATSAPAHADVFLTFRPSVTAGIGVSPEGCLMEAGPALGQLGGPGPYNYQHECHSAVLGFDGDGEAAGQLLAAPSTFTSSPFENGLELAGLATVHVHYVSYNGSQGRITYALFDVSPLGIATLIDFGVAIENLRTSIDDAGQTGSFNVGHHYIAPGNRLRLALMSPLAGAAAGRLLFGGQPLSREVPALGAVMPAHDFEDAGLFLATPQTGGGSESPPGVDPVVDPSTNPGATPDPQSEPQSQSGQSAESGAGSLPGFLLLPLAIAGLVRKFLKRKWRSAASRRHQGETMATAVAAVLMSVAGAACAEDSFGRDLQPTLNVRVEFGAPSSALRTEAQLDLRPADAHRPASRAIDAERVVTRTPLDALIEPRALPLIQLAFDRDAVQALKFLGQDPRPSMRLNQNAQEGGSSGWSRWWIAGGAVAAVGVALAVTGGGGDDSATAENEPASSCDASSATYVMGQTVCAP